MRRDYSVPFGVACLLHVGVLAFLFVSFQSSVTLSQAKQPKAAPQPKVVEAVVVDQKAVEKQIAKIQDAEAAKRRRVQAWEQRARKAKQARLAEQKKVQAEVKRMAELNKKRRAKEKDLSLLAKQQAAEKAKIAKLKAAQRQAEAKKQQAEKQLHVAKQKAAEHQTLTEQLEAEEAARSQARRAQVQKEVDKYTQLIHQAISRNWVLYDTDVDGKRQVVLHVRASSDGSVLTVSIAKSSGDGALDRSAKNAVLKASPLPMPRNSELYAKVFREFNVTMRPEEVMRH